MDQSTQQHKTEGKCDVIQTPDGEEAWVMMRSDASEKAAHEHHHDHTCNHSHRHLHTILIGLILIVSLFIGLALFS